MRTTALLCAIVITLAHCASSADPAGVVRDFYGVYIADRPAGLPDGAMLDRLRPFLSRNLQSLIDSALATQREFIQRHPDEKPPFVDGDHFSSLFEGPASFEITEVTDASAERWDVRVRFRRDQVEWSDTVVVAKENGRYVIDDVVFSGIGDFNPPGRLSEALRKRETVD